MTAVAAVDVAWWDIKAKAPGMPLYQLLGGASRERMLCYTHANGDVSPGRGATIDEEATARFPSSGAILT
jgi:L-alanine-DL-glutamate epimerase-like enolase superfamily enzyme